jgi:hypothetical protein
MGKRAEQRIPAVLPVVVMGSDAEGKPVRQLAWTVDVSGGGARLVGVPALKTGETVTLSHNDRKGRFRVLWVGGKNTALTGQMSVRAVEPENWIWSIPRPKSSYRDAFREQRERGSAGEEAADATRKQNLARRMSEVAEELKALEELAQAENLDPRLLMPLREALGYAAQAITGVHAWLDAAAAGRDPFVALTELTLARLRLTASLAAEMATELEGGDLPTTTDDVSRFCNAITGCARRISGLMRT